jgi:hypothetical protein
MDSCQLPNVQEKKPKPNKALGNNVAKKTIKTNKPKPIMKLAGFTRAETHIGIARFISERNKRN